MIRTEEWLNDQVDGYEIKCRNCDSTDVVVDTDYRSYELFGLECHRLKCDECGEHEEIATSNINSILNMSKFEIVVKWR